LCCICKQSDVQTLAVIKWHRRFLRVYNSCKTIETLSDAIVAEHQQEQNDSHAP